MSRTIRSTGVALMLAALLAALFAYGSPSATAATTRTMLDGGGSAGLNGDAANAGALPTLIAYKDHIYALWTESSQIRVKRYSGSEWTFVDGGTALNIDAAKEAMTPSAVVYHDELYVAWQERGSNGYWKLRVKKYDGTSWTSVDENADHGLNYGQYDQGQYPALAVWDDALIVAWAEFTGMNNKLMVKKYKNGAWQSLDGGGATGINKDSTKSVLSVSLTVLDGVLYAGWAESGASGAYQVRVAKYAGSSWSFIDGNGANGLNKDTTQWAFSPKLLTYQDELYAIWQEVAPLPYGNRDEVRVAKYDGASWSFVDGDAVTGLNYTGTNAAQGPSAVVLGSHMYAVWAEGSNDVMRLRLAEYDGTSWQFVDGGNQNPLNVSPQRNVVSPTAIVVDGKLTLGWIENNGTANQVRVAVVGFADAAPTATSVTVSGTLRIGQTLEGGYAYSDAEQDAEGVSTYRWYAADDAAGTNKQPIAGAESRTFVVTAAQLHKYVSFEVTPAAATGTAVGASAASGAVGPVSVFKGDANGDGLVTPADVLLANKYIQGKTTLTAEQFAALDIDEDGDVDATDATLIMNIYLGKGG